MGDNTRERRRRRKRRRKGKGKGKNEAEREREKEKAKRDKRVSLWLKQTGVSLRVRKKQTESKEERLAERGIVM